MFSANYQLNSDYQNNLLYNHICILSLHLPPQMIVVKTNVWYFDLQYLKKNPSYKFDFW